MHQIRPDFVITDSRSMTTVNVPMLLLVNINQREENLVKLSLWSQSPLIGSRDYECWVSLLSPTVNRHCPLISGSQMFQAKLWLHWITFYSIIFLHKGRRQPQLVSSCNALSMSQIVVSCRRSQQDSPHCHPHEEHCSLLTCSYSHSPVLAEPGTKSQVFTRPECWRLTSVTFLVFLKACQLPGFLLPV